MPAATPWESCKTYHCVVTPKWQNKTKALPVSSLMRTRGLLEWFKDTNVNYSQGTFLCRSLARLRMPSFLAASSLS